MLFCNSKLGRLLYSLLSATEPACFCSSYEVGNICRKWQGLSLSISSQYLMSPRTRLWQGFWGLQQLLHRHSVYPCFSYWQLFIFHLCVWMCLWVCPRSPEEVVWSPGAGVMVTHLPWVLGHELVFSGRAASTCNHLIFFFSISQFLLLERDCVMPTLFFKDLVTGKSHDSYVNFSIKIINVSSIDESQCKQSFLLIAPLFISHAIQSFRERQICSLCWKCTWLLALIWKIFCLCPFLLSQDREKEWERAREQEREWARVS